MSRTACTICGAVGHSLTRCTAPGAVAYWRAAVERHRARAAEHQRAADGAQPSAAGRSIEAASEYHARLATLDRDLAERAVRRLRKLARLVAA